VICNYANFFYWLVSRDWNVMLLNLWVIRNYILTLLHYVIDGELWCSWLKLCCLSEPGNVEFWQELINTYGTISRVWIGPNLAVFLAEAKYVEVSKLALALWTKQQWKNIILNCDVTRHWQWVSKWNCCIGPSGYKS